MFRAFQSLITYFLAEILYIITTYIKSSDVIIRDWSPKFATGLNVIIGIDQKIYE